MNVTDFYVLVLDKLKVVGQGQTASNEDREKVRVAYESMLQILIDENLVDWIAGEDLPDWAPHVMRDLVAAELASDFGVEGEDLRTVVIEGKWNLQPPLGPSMAERRLRRHQSVAYIRTPAIAEYF